MQPRKDNRAMSNAWTALDIAGKKADIYDPPGRPRFGILFLHATGLETLHDNPVYTRLLAELNLACVSPHGQRCWWTDRVCEEFDARVTPERYLLDSVIPFFQERWGLKPRAIGLLGISMGGQGALRLAFKHPELFPVVAGISSALDCYELYGQDSALDRMYDSKEQCRQDTALMHLPPYHAPPHIFYCIDPDDLLWYRGNDRLHEKMNALGVAHTADLTTRAGGHSWQYFDHMAEPALRFVYQGLEQESRRLL
jgi:pimeloyl-ACP methyl ester carboxylesterase